MRTRSSLGHSASGRRRTRLEKVWGRVTKPGLGWKRGPGTPCLGVAQGVGETAASAPGGFQDRGTGIASGVSQANWSLAWLSPG